MAILTQESTAIALDGSTVNGDIFITSVTPPVNPNDPGSLTITGSGTGFIAAGNQITLQPTSEQVYPVVYNLTLNLAEGLGFSFAMPVGQLSILQNGDEQSGFLLNSPMLNIYHGTRSSPPLPFLYNLALQFSNGTSTFWVDDPTIVFEPPQS
jgi:hypothetical protein